MTYLGDIAAQATVSFTFDVTNKAGASTNPTVNGAIQVFKDGSATPFTTGITYTMPFASLAGHGYVSFPTTDAFFTAGSEYRAVLVGATIDGETVNKTVAHFSIENRVTVLSAAEANKLADHYWRRNYANARQSSNGDAFPVGARCGLTAMAWAVNRFGPSGNNVLVYDEDDTTVRQTVPVTTDPAAEPITGADPT